MSLESNVLQNLQNSQQIRNRHSQFDKFAGNKSLKSSTKQSEIVQQNWDKVSVASNDNVVRSSSSVSMNSQKSIMVNNVPNGPSVRKSEKIIQNEIQPEEVPQISQNVRQVSVNQRKVAVEQTEKMSFNQTFLIIGLVILAISFTLYSSAQIDDNEVFQEMFIEDLPYYQEWETQVKVISENILQDIKNFGMVKKEDMKKSIFDYYRKEAETLWPLIVKQIQQHQDLVKVEEIESETYWFKK